MSAPGKSHGRKTIRAQAQPTALLTEAPALHGAWTARVITLFPEAFPGILGASLTGKALAEGLWTLELFDLRRFGVGRHRDVDDAPVGGGPGMVLRADVLATALAAAGAGRAPASAARERHPLICLSPRGHRFDQRMAARFSRARGITLICGRFEGVDQRLLDAYEVCEVSLGDFILTGGEIAAQALIDASVRLIPRVLGNQASVEEESFSTGLLEHPQFTKPVDWDGRRVPDILLSGHHAKIAAWRHGMAERLTKKRRPDLWRAYCAQHGRDPDGDQEL